MLRPQYPQYLDRFRSCHVVKHGNRHPNTHFWKQYHPRCAGGNTLPIVKILTTEPTSVTAHGSSSTEFVDQFCYLKQYGWWWIWSGIQSTCYYVAKDTKNISMMKWGSKHRVDTDQYIHALLAPLRNSCIRVPFDVLNTRINVPCTYTCSACHINSTFQHANNRNKKV